jgi:hypothetical protein
MSRNPKPVAKKRKPAPTPRPWREAFKARSPGRMPSMDAYDMRDFVGYLSQCTNSQVQGVYDKESSSGRVDYAFLALQEAAKRGLALDVCKEET